MKIFRRSFSEDEVDRYNHTWAVILLIVLSLTTWLLPLTQTPRNGDVTSFRNVKNKPRYIANCWFPPEFTSSMQAYSLSACSDAFNRAINDVDTKENENTTFGLASLYYAGNGDVLQEQTKFSPVVQDNSMNNNQKQYSNKAQVRSEDINYINVNTPIFLFVLAVCLKIIHILWTLSSDCAGIGMNKILESAKAAQFLDVGVRSQFKLDLVKSFTGKLTSFSAGLLYLMFKVLTCIVTVVGVVIIRSILLPQIEDIQLEQTRIDTNVALKEPVFYPENLICDIKIRRLQNIATYAFQCMFTPESYSLSTDSTYSPNSSEQQIVHFRLYEAMYTSLAVFFAALSAVNIASILIWIIRLTPGPFRKQAFFNSNLSTDVYLLLYMARQNVGLLVAKDLEESFGSGSRNGEKTDQELENLTGNNLS